jgi:hypothetical protein
MYFVAIKMGRRQEMATKLRNIFFLRREGRFPGVSSGLETLALGLAIVPLENSSTEPMPKNPQNNNATLAPFEIAPLALSAWLCPFIREKCIGDLYQTSEIARCPD